MRATRSLHLRAVGLVAVALLTLTACASLPDGLVVEGPPAGALVGGPALEAPLVTVRAEDDDALAGVTVLVDGTDTELGVTREEGLVGWGARGLTDGDHEVVVTWASAADARPQELARFTLTVDATPPALTVESPAPPVVAGQERTLTGSSEPGVTIAVGDASVIADDTGAFELAVTPTVGPPVRVSATDAAGNVTVSDTSLVTVPSRVEVDETRGVHVTACGWSSTEKRERILAMADEGRINAVVLTIKGEDGLVSFDWPEFLDVVDDEVLQGSCRIDLEEVVADLHARDIQVVGRIVAFRDPVLARHAWDAGETDMVIQTTDGEPYKGYGGFLNPANADVVAYNIALAEVTAAAGVDVILWDYVRRPDGRLEALVLPGLTGTVEEVVAAFVAEADARLAPYGVQHGASVYGIAATRPREIGQDLTAMGPHLDIVAPMIYPSHWGPGEYGLSEPVRSPYDIVALSLVDHVAVLEGTRARVVPWLEDTAYRAWDRPFQVREQIRATYDGGIRGWMLWDPSNVYTPDSIAAPE